MTSSFLALAAPLVAALPLSGPAPQRGSKADAPTGPWRLEITQGGPAHGFGHALAVLGDLDGDGWDEVAVGAPCAGRDAPGAVWVVSGRDGKVRWKREGEQSGDEFGHALAALHWDADGVLDLAVGARLAQVDGLRVGRVTVHSGLDGAQLARFDGSETAGHFGAALAALEDRNEDGRSELAIGAPGEAAGHGAVHLHAGRTGVLLARFTGERAEHQLGWAIAPFTDVSADRIPDLLVGAPGNPLRAPDAGAFEVRHGITGRTLRTYWGQARGDRLGESITSVGDVDGDTIPEIAVAAPSAGDADTPDVGRVDLLSGKRGELLATWRGTDAGDFFGRALAAGRGWTGASGAVALAVGAPYAENPAAPTAVRPGAVFVYDVATRELVHRFAGTRSRDHFGAAIAVARTPAGEELWIGAPARGDILQASEEKLVGYVRVATLAPPLAAQPAR